MSGYQLRQARYGLGCTQQELADLVGTTREPLTRAISTLRRAQILEVHDGRYLVKNPQKLSGLCLPLTS